MAVPSSIVPSPRPAPVPEVYFETIFVVPLPPPVWPLTFAIVTAHNPHGATVPEQANNQYDRALREYLEAEGISSFAVVGASRDLTHHEGGRGIVLENLQTAAHISARFEQKAFYWVDGGVVFLCIDGSGRGWEVGPWSQRLRP